MSQSLGRLDLNLLRIFAAIYKAQNISRAAQELGVSQPTLSNALSRLRRALDDPLFVRAARGVVPTPRSEDLIHPVRRILSEVDAIVEPDKGFDPLTSHRQFRLSIVESLEQVVMADLVKAALAGRGMSFQLMRSAGHQVEDALHTGATELAVNFPAPYHRDLLWEALTPIDLVVVARKDHPTIQGAISLAQMRETWHASLDLSPDRMANARLLRITPPIERKDMVLVSRVSSLLELVARTDLVAVASRIHAQTSALADRLQILEMPEKANDPNFHVTWHARSRDDAGLAWLREQVHRAVARAIAAQQDVAA